MSTMPWLIINVGGRAILTGVPCVFLYGVVVGCKCARHPSSTPRPCLSHPASFSIMTSPPPLPPLPTTDRLDLAPRPPKPDTPRNTTEGNVTTTSRSITWLAREIPPHEETDPKARGWRLGKAGRYYDLRKRKGDLTSPTIKSLRPSVQTNRSKKPVVWKMSATLQRSFPRAPWSCGHNCVLG